MRVFGAEGGVIDESRATSGEPRPAPAGTGSASAQDLVPLVYRKLRDLAAARMRHEPAGSTLQPTALVHEVYLRLASSGEQKWESEGHLLGAAAVAMRRILVEHARRRKTR